MVFQEIKTNTLGVILSEVIFARGRELASEFVVGKENFYQEYNKFPGNQGAEKRAGP